MATIMSTSTCNSGPKPEILLATASMHNRDAAKASNTTRKNVHVGACMRWPRETFKCEPLLIIAPPLPYVLLPAVKLPLKVSDHHHQR